MRIKQGEEFSTVSGITKELLRYYILPPLFQPLLPLLPPAAASESQWVGLGIFLYTIHTENLDGLSFTL